MHKQEPPPCPELEASFLSRLFFLWSNGLAEKVKEGSVTETDFWELNPREKCETVCPPFDKALSRGHGYKDPHGHSTESETSSIPPMSNHSTDFSGPIRHRKTGESFGNTTRNGVAHRHDTQTDRPYRKNVEHFSLWVVIIKTFWREFMQTMVVRFFQYCTYWIVNPYFISFLIETTADPHSSVWNGVMLSTALLVLMVTGNMCFEHSTYTSHTLEMHLRSALMTSVYKKAMNLHSKSRKNYSIGEMTNYMSSDCDAIAEHLTHITYVMYTPVHFIIVFYQLYQILGVAAFFGLIVIIVIMPINVYIAVKMRSLLEENSENTDEKMKLLNEVLTGIKVLKLNAWEKCFGNKLGKARQKELDVLARIFKTRAFDVFSWNASPYVISMVIFSAYFYLNEESILTAKTAFSALAMLNLLRFAINQTPELVFDVIKANVAIGRLEKFLCEDEYEQIITRSTRDKANSIEMDNASFTWDTDTVPTIKNIDLTIPQCGLVAVVGQVGSGKSSIISAILGECEKIQGHLGVNGSTAYVSQQAWIQNDSLQNNILFGKSMDKQVYDQVIKACALQPDIDLLPAGDKTEIGERGINLSGGQKQRVSLARAVYNNADIYLLDDPLSAVDSHVGKHIFDNVVSEKGLLKNKTRILVTHNIRYLPEVDNIIVVDDGEIAESGSFLELLNSDGMFNKVLKTYLAEYAENRECIEEEDDGEEGSLDKEVKSKLRRLESEEVSEHSSYERQISRQTSHTTSRQNSRHLSTSEEKQDDSGKCIEEEDRKIVSGKEKWNLFLQYAKSFGLGNTSTVIAAYGLHYLSFVVAQIWLVTWTEDPVFKSNSDGTAHNTTGKDILWRTNMMYLGVYSGLGIFMTLCIFIYTIFMTSGVVRAATEMHEKMLMSILKSPMEFFDTTPVGRITSRFSKDMGVIESDLPYGLEFYFDSALQIIVSMMAVLYSTPSMLALIIPLGMYYFYLQQSHTRRCNVMCDLESKTRSPIESHFTESVMGADTVRAYKAQCRFLEKLEDKINNYHRMVFYSLLNHRWLGIHMLGVGNVVCAASAFTRTVFKGTQSAAKVGLGTILTTEINGCMGWFVLLQSETATNIISIDRITQYINCPNEAEWRKCSSTMPRSWPAIGKLEFRNYSLRYRQGLDLVLRNISFTVEGGEKIGVVGRTGAGKSSLMLSLFRLVEAAEGAIFIDGVDIGEIGLHDLREKLAIIPQDPVLFTGSLRMNLDPQDLYTDQDIWTALDHTHLRQFVESLPDSLQSECGEGGNNFSVGQRQLFCMARTLLRKAKVLVLDEATAAVDMETDDLIQQTIRSEFRDCTVLTIAHRLNTVMDYDRILVLDQGEVKEFDTPDRLLQEKGLFHKMIVDAGLKALSDD